MNSSRALWSGGWGCVQMAGAACTQAWGVGGGSVFSGPCNIAPDPSSGHAGKEGQDIADYLNAAPVKPIKPVMEKLRVLLSQTRSMGRVISEGWDYYFRRDR